jgi:hypothetical protein
MLSLGIKGSRSRDPPTDPSRIVRELGSYTHRVRSRVPSGKGTKPSPSTPAATARDSGVRPSLRLPTNASLDPILGSLLAFGASQGSGSRWVPRATDARGGSLALPRGRGPVSCSSAPTGLRTGRDARRQTPPLASGARRLPGPRVSPSSRTPSPPRRLPKVHLVEASPSRHSLTLSVSKQSSWAAFRASSAPRHRHGPHDAAARPS